TTNSFLMSAIEAHSIIQPEYFILRVLIQIIADCIHHNERMLLMNIQKAIGGTKVEVDLKNDLCYTSYRKG
ncbi:MAG: hypothetical protein EZS28_042029, partial [Streblomastix strix]